jgi:hypothetical protein
MAKRLLKPQTVMNKWAALCKKVKEDKTRRKAPGRREATRHAAMCGMKSMLEVEVAALLDKKKIPWEYETHKFDYHMCPNWEYECNVKWQTYNPDFYLPGFDFYLEVKGKMTLDTRKKMVAVKLHNPEIDIKIVFGAAKNKLYATPNSSRYWEWAEKEGFEWSEKDILKEWMI